MYVHPNNHHIYPYPYVYPRPAIHPKPGVCPGCGRCDHCGRPQPRPWYSGPGWSLNGPAPVATLTVSS